MEKVRHCKTCKWYQDAKSIGEEEKLGLCHLNPPTVIGGALLPQTAPDSWCSHHVVLRIRTRTNRKTKESAAKSFLESLLSNGSLQASYVYSTASAEGISKRALERAKAALGVESEKIKTGPWIWKMPPRRPTDDEASK